MHQALQARGIAHRVIERNREQILYVDQAEQAAFAEVLEHWQRGDYASMATKRIHALQGLSLRGLQFAPVTALLLLCSALGYGMIFIPLWQAWLVHLTFVPVTIQGDWLAFQTLADTLARGEYWRFVTPAFLHFSILHLVFNGLWVWELGRRIERLNGAFFAVLFFLTTAFAANLSQYLWTEEATLFGGMSGVVYAYLGYIAVRHKISPHPITALPRGVTTFMLVWLVICLTGIVDAVIAGGIANGAHLGGLLAGIAIALLQLLIQHKSLEPK